jgi:hypothetical protein
MSVAGKMRPLRGENLNDICTVHSTLHRVLFGSDRWGRVLLCAFHRFVRGARAFNGRWINKSSHLNDRYLFGDDSSPNGKYTWRLKFIKPPSTMLQDESIQLQLLIVIKFYLQRD